VTETPIEAAPEPIGDTSIPGRILGRSADGIFLRHSDAVRTYTNTARIGHAGLPLGHVISRLLQGACEVEGKTEELDHLFRS
jgi:hypothetical protein